jgi:hypothetical protein
MNEFLSLEETRQAVTGLLVSAAEHNTIFDGIGFSDASLEPTHLLADGIDLRLEGKDGLVPLIT